MKKRKGAALVYAICVFAVMVIFAILITNYTLSNALQAKQQQANTQAYYLVASGIELGVNAVLANKLVDVVDPDTGAPTTEEVHGLLYEFSQDPLRTPIKDHVDFSGDDTMTVDITISAVDKNGAKITRTIAPSDVWVEIYAQSTYKTQTGTTTYAGDLRMSTENPSLMFRNYDMPNSRE